LASSMLSLSKVRAGYGETVVLEDVELSLPERGSLAVLGRNGVGKTTLLATIMGLTTFHAGAIEYRGAPIAGLPTHARNRLGIGYVPEGQGIFATLTVDENLRVAQLSEGAPARERLQHIFGLFPDLERFRRARAGTLSGGQKQMLAIARAFINPNRLLLIDEPSKGLAPIIVEHLVEALSAMKRHATVLLVEQNFAMAQALGDDFYLIDDGRTVHQGSMASLAADDALKKKYLGI